MIHGSIESSRIFASGVESPKAAAAANAIGTPGQRFERRAWSFRVILVASLNEWCSAFKSAHRYRQFLMVNSIGRRTGHLCRLRVPFQALNPRGSARTIKINWTSHEETMTTTLWVGDVCVCAENKIVCVIRSGPFTRAHAESLSLNPVRYARK